MNSIILNKFSDIADKVDVLFDKVEFYENSNVIKVGFLKEETTFCIKVEEVNCIGNIKFHSNGALMRIQPAEDDDYKGFTNEVYFYENGLIEYGMTDSHYTNFWGAKNDLKYVEIHGKAWITYSEDGNIIDIDVYDKEEDKLLYKTGSYKYLKFDEEGNITHFGLLDGRTVDVKRETQFYKNIIKDIATGGNKIKEIKEVLKKFGYEN